MANERFYQRNLSCVVSENEACVLSNEENIEGAKRLFYRVHLYSVIFMWIPIFTINNPKLTKVLSWIGLSISVLYQCFHFSNNTFESVEKFPVPGIDNTTGRTAEIVINERMYEAIQLPASIIYLLIRLLLYIMLWIRSSDLREILTLIFYSVSNDKSSMHKISKSICPILYLTIIITVIAHVIIFYCTPHNFNWKLLSRVYDSVIILSIVMIYYFMIHGYQVMFESFFINICYNDIDVILTRIKLHNIKTAYEIIERKFGFFIFFVFCMNYIEIFYTVLVVPQLSQFDLRNREIFLWIISIFSSGTNLIAIFIIMVKVDLQKWSTDKHSRKFQRRMVEYNSETDVKLLVLDVKETINLRFTAWLGFIPIRRSILVSYPVNLIVYSNLLFQLVRWLVS